MRMGKTGTTLDKKKIIFNIIYGIAMVSMGVMMFVTIPSKMAELEKVQSAPVMYFARFSLYFASVVLFFGGMKKFIGNYRRLSDNGTDRAI